jgi:hypothetical protein
LLWLRIKVILGKRRDCKFFSWQNQQIFFSLIYLCDIKI